MLTEIRPGVVIFRGVEAPAEVNAVLCVVGGCEHPRSARALCTAHYQRWRRAGGGIAARARGARGPAPMPLSAEELAAFETAEALIAEAKLTPEQALARRVVVALLGANYARHLQPWQFEQEAKRALATRTDGAEK